MKTFTTDLTNSHRNVTGSLRKVATHAALTLVVAAALAGCNGQADSTPVINGENNANSAPLTTDTDQIIRNAAANIAGPMQQNYSGIVNMANTVASTPAVEQMLKSMDDGSSAVDSDRSIAASTNTQDQRSDETTEFDIEQLLMMFVTESDGATTTRNGNTITIDPDDNSVCQELLSDSNDSNAMNSCSQFISGFDIKIVAATDDAGSVTVQFDQQAIITMTYSPDSSIMELQLQGIHTAMEQYLVLENEGGTLPEVMRGALKLSANITGDSSQPEQVFGSLSITEAIEIIDSSENITLSLRPSTLMAMQATASSEKISFHIDGLKFSELIENQDATSTAVAVISIPGFTADFEVHDDDSVKVTQLGFGKGPFSVTIDDARMIKLTLEQFGFHIDGDTELLTLNEALNFSLAVDNIGGYLTDDMPSSFNALLTANAAASTALQEQENQSIKVTGGGPISFDYQINDGTNNPAGSVSVNAGECFYPPEDSETAENQLFEIVACN